MLTNLRCFKAAKASLRPQDPTQQVGARFAALAATCVACEAGGAVATMPTVLKEISESNEASEHGVTMTHIAGFVSHSSDSELSKVTNFKQIERGNLRKLLV